jgi:Fic family protein
MEALKTRIVAPNYDSPVMDLIIDLEKLRTKKMGGTTDRYVFFQIKNIFHFLESIGSARIEGNNTTISDYIETKIDGTANITTGIQEIKNIENAINYIEKFVKETDINKTFVSELHSMVVENLEFVDGGEGDKTPGIYRVENIKIGKSKHKPIDWILVDEYMDELFGFINTDLPQKYDLLKIAITHHRFLWIHPFCNGNGRTIRLITYAMLVKYGFNVNSARALNPTAIFCNDRQEYYDKLAQADINSDEGILIWCEYVLTGLKVEIEKVDKLADYSYLSKEILIPAVNYCFEKEYIKEIEVKILRKTIELQHIVANDIKSLLPNKVKSELSRQIKLLVGKKMLIPLNEKARKYRLCFEGNDLLKGIIHALGDNGFLPSKNELLILNGRN